MQSPPSVRLFTLYVSVLGQIERSIDLIDLAYWYRPAGRRRPSGFCDTMRLSDFIDFISVEREREDDDVSCSRCDHSFVTARGHRRRRGNCL